mmetsp:Transcript_5328/g.10548  ORF Transcript_5328/g.10548 Transcript_5328/m.10548 type:complete len:169 (+) Transcript_5328:143-649(+)
MGVPPYCSSCESQQRLPPAVMLMMRSVRQTVSYCSKDCQRAHRKQHKPHCQAVRDLVESIGSGSTITTSADQNERGSSVGANDQGPDEEAETLAAEACQHKRPFHFIRRQSHWTRSTTSTIIIAEKPFCYFLRILCVAATRSTNFISAWPCWMPRPRWICAPSMTSRG